MDRPFLRIAPFKVEVLHLNPDVYLFHQVLTDETSDILVSLAKNKVILRLHKRLTNLLRKCYNTHCAQV